MNDHVQCSNEFTWGSESVSADWFAFVSCCELAYEVGVDVPGVDADSVGESSDHVFTPDRWMLTGGHNTYRVNGCQVVCRQI